MGVRALIGLVAVAAASLAALPSRAEVPTPKVAAQSFRSAGLRPAVRGGFVHSVRYGEQALVLDRSSASLGGGDGPVRLEIGRDLVFDLAIRQPRSVSAPLAFVGYGLPAQPGGRDDFDGQDLRGRVAVYLDATPLFLTPERARAARALARAAAERAGALGLIAVDVSEAAWNGRIERWTGVGLHLADASLRPTRGPQLAAAMAPAAAARIFARSGYDLASLSAAARAGRPLPAFALATRIEAVVETRSRQGAAQVVAAMAPGVDPYLARNSVVVSAPRADAVILAELARTAPAPRRSLVYALLPPELPADLAARALAHELGLGREAPVAAIHLDQASGPAISVAGAAESSLGDTAMVLGDKLGLAVAPSRGSAAIEGFALGGTPAITLAGRGSERWLLALTREVANQPERPSWKLNSPFAPPLPPAQGTLTAPLEMPVGKRPQKILPSYGALRPDTLSDVG